MERQVGDVDTIDEQRPCGHLHHAARARGEVVLADPTGPTTGHQLAGCRLKLTSLEAASRWAPS